MEKRKSLIFRELQSISEQTSILYENLDKIIQQVTNQAELAKTFNENIQPHDLTQIISYELKIQQTLTDVNLQLETLLENVPFKSTVLNVQPQLSIAKSDSEHLDIPSQQVLEPEVTPEVTLDDEPESLSTVVEVPEGTFVEMPETVAVNAVSSSSTENSSHNITGHFSEDQIQSLRSTFKEISEKLGFNEPNLSTMKDFYEKPSTSFIRDCSTQMTSGVKTENNISNTSIACDDNFQIPEKDLNTTSCSAPYNELNIYDQAIGITNNLENCLTPSTSHQTLNMASESSSIDTDLDDTCDFFSTLSESDSRDNRNLNNVVQPSCSNQTVCSAVEKLNNYRRVANEDLLEIEPLHLPDIKLKPTKLEDIEVIQNLNPQGLETKKGNVDDSAKTNTDLSGKKHQDESEKKNYKLKPKNLPTIGMQCVFSHIETPEEFYIHIADKETSRIDDVSDEIGYHYGGSVSPYKTKKEAYKVLKQFCVVNIPDYWYRAEVLDWCLEQDSEDVVVQLVDYGSRRRTSFKNLRKLLKQFARLPKLAIRCNLPLIYPPGSTLQNRLTEWPLAAIESLMELGGLFSIEQQKSKFFEIAWLCFDEVQNSLAIDLVAENQDDTVGQILIDLGLVVQLVDDNEEDQPELREFLQDVDELEIADNINEAVMGYDARDEARICRFSKRDGTCYKGKHCKLEHKILPKDGFTTDTEVVFKEAMYSLPLPTIGDWIQVLVTGYVDICSFFVQIIRTPHQEKTYVMDKDLFNLLETMNSTKNVVKYERFKIAPALGEIVLAKHWSNKWLRAVVRDFTTNEDGDPLDVHVFYVDFGDTMKVTMKDVRKIQPHFLQLPFQAVKCYINDYKMSENCCPVKVRKFFNENMCFKNFVAETMSSQIPLKLHLRSIKGQQNVGQSLERFGWAERRTFDIYPQDGCIIGFD